MMRLLLFISLFLLIGCEKAKYIPIDIPEEGGELPTLVKSELTRKYNIYRANIERKCKEKAYRRAVKFVDSIIIEELNLQHLDDVNFPGRPERPKLPEGIILNDSIEPGPI